MCKVRQQLQSRRQEKAIRPSTDAPSKRAERHAPYAIAKVVGAGGRCPISPEGAFCAGSQQDPAPVKDGPRGPCQDSNGHHASLDGQFVGALRSRALGCPLPSGQPTEVSSLHGNPDASPTHRVSCSSDWAIVQPRNVGKTIQSRGNVMG